MSLADFKQLASAKLNRLQTRATIEPSSAATPEQPRQFSYQPQTAEISPCYTVPQTTQRSTTSLHEAPMTTIRDQQPYTNSQARSESP